MFLLFYCFPQELQVVKRNFQLLIKSIFRVKKVSGSNENEDGEGKARKAVQFFLNGKERVHFFGSKLH